MKKFTNYFTLLLSLWFILGATKGKAQCVANFNYSINANGNVTFTANCTPANSITTQYYWQFGNNTAYTATGTPIAQVTYTANGTYTVNLFYYTPTTCSNSVSYTINITNAATSTCNVNANFTYTQGANGLVNFSSTSTGTVAGTVFNWQYGYNTSGGTGANTSNTFPANGLYNVTLYVFNSTNPLCMDSVVIPVTVNTLPCSLNASFNYTIGTGGNVNFASTSTGTTNTSLYIWNFGDATNGSGNPTSHTYANSGTYIATLTVNNGSLSSCVDTYTQSVVIPCMANSNFSLVPTATAQVWNAYVGSPANIVAATWSWGDNSTSNTLYTSHTYSASGTYSICLSVTVTCGASATTCINQFIYRSEQNMQMIQVNVIPQSMPTSIVSNNINVIDYSVYPNPNNGQFEIKLNGNGSETANIKVYNLIGKLVYETETVNDNSVKNINLDNVSNGVYFIKVNANNKEFTKKIIVSK